MLKVTTPVQFELESRKGHGMEPNKPLTAKVEPNQPQTKSALSQQVSPESSPDFARQLASQLQQQHMLQQQQPWNVGQLSMAAKFLPQQNNALSQMLALQSKHMTGQQLQHLQQTISQQTGATQQHQTMQPFSQQQRTGSPQQPISQTSAASAPSLKSTSTSDSENPIQVEFRTALLDKYWRNDRRNLQCFPFCPKFKDYKHHKEYVTETDTAKSYCNQPYDVSIKFNDPELARNPNLRVYGRFREVYNTASLANGTSCFIPRKQQVQPQHNDDETSTETKPLNNATTETETTTTTTATTSKPRSGGSAHWDTMSSSVKEEIPLYAAGNVINEDNAPALGGMTKPFPYCAQYLMLTTNGQVTYRFSPSHWKYTSKLPKTRIAIMNTTHCFEVVVALEKKRTQSDGKTCGTELEIICVAASPAFKIANTRSLLRLKRQQDSAIAANAAEQTANSLQLQGVAGRLPGNAGVPVLDAMGLLSNDQSPHQLNEATLKLLQQQAQLQQYQLHNQFNAQSAAAAHMQAYAQQQMQHLQSSHATQHNPNKRFKSMPGAQQGNFSNAQTAMLNMALQQQNLPGASLADTLQQAAMHGTSKQQLMQGSMFQAPRGFDPNQLNAYLYASMQQSQGAQMGSPFQYQHPERPANLPATQSQMHTSPNNVSAAVLYSLLGQNAPRPPPSA